MTYLSLTQHAHHLLSEAIEPGATVVDATIGNGKDTLFLAQSVGESGKVYGFDIQEEAIVNTTTLLNQNGLFDRVKLFCFGHETLLRHLPAFCHGNVSAITFNLGYLPSGNKSIITKPESTLKALTCSVELLKVGGLLSIMSYHGHPGGKEELTAIRRWISSLSKQDAFFVSHENKNNLQAPQLFLIKKI